MVQHRVVGQCLNRGHADKRCKCKVLDEKFVPVPFEIRLEQREVLAAETLQLLELADAWNLFGEHAMQLWIDAVRLDCGSDQLAYPRLARLVQTSRQVAADGLHDLPLVALDDSGDERLLAGEI